MNRRVGLGQPTKMTAGVRAFIEQQIRDNDETSASPSSPQPHHDSEDTPQVSQQQWGTQNRVPPLGQAQTSSILAVPLLLWSFKYPTCERPSSSFQGASYYILGNSYPSIKDLQPAAQTTQKVSKEERTIFRSEEEQKCQSSDLCKANSIPSVRQLAKFS